jgi:2-polyprenyl-6-methoxyphenol hydroxylase-like FAD-dependent oxidoreductase
MARLIVVGGSLGGLLAANMLLREGHAVTLVEKAAGSLDGRGAGIVTHEALFTGLRRAGVTVDGQLGVSVASRRVLARDGSVEASLELPQVLTSWSRLYALMTAALPAGHALPGHAVHAIEATADSVRVHCQRVADGAPVVLEGEGVVASDGIRSVARAQVLPLAEPVYAGYVAWRGVCDESVLSRHTLGTLFEHFGFGLPAGEQMLGYPVAGPRNATARGQRRYNFVWYRAAAEPALRELLTDADGEHHPGGIPPNRVSWRQVAAMREAGRALLAPQFAEVLEKTAQPFLQPIYDVVSSRIAHGRLALMGDAAFVARPHVGMGVTKAAEDAMALCDALAEHPGDVPRAWQAYDARRQGPGEAAVQRSRLLGAYMQAQGRADADAVQRSAEGVLRDTAVDLGARPWTRWTALAEAEPAVH